jgi:hypothetical protein
MKSPISRFNFNREEPGSTPELISENLVSPLQVALTPCTQIKKTIEQVLNQIAQCNREWEKWISGGGSNNSFDYNAYKAAKQKCYDALVNASKPKGKYQNVACCMGGETSPANCYAVDPVTGCDFGVPENALEYANALKAYMDCLAKARESSGGGNGPPGTSNNFSNCNPGTMYQLNKRLGELVNSLGQCLKTGEDKLPYTFPNAFPKIPVPDSGVDVVAE